MNYVELHLGDWAQAVAHLSMTEEAVYLRLLRRYYADEKPLPVDVAACQRLAGARSPEEREAVQVVLAEFFVLTDEGHRNKRADAEIAKFKEGEPEREAKRANERERQQRAREERRRLFEELRELGVVPAYDATTAELRRLLSQHVTRDVTRTDGARPGDVTATQTPDTNTQKKDQELGATAPSADKPPTSVVQRLEQVRIAEITDEAIEAYNRLLAEPLSLPKASPVGIDKKRAWVRRSLKTIREVCRAAYGSERIEARFWSDYFATQAADDFIAGRSGRTGAHANWRPDFEYLTRPDVIAKAFERTAQ